MSPPTTPTRLLRDALIDEPARPLITWYDGAGARVELSLVTFDNWVAKTANLLVDELDAQPGVRVALDLPEHWLGLVWCSAVWAAGGVVVLGAGPVAEISVGHDQEAAADHGAAEHVVVPRHPLALPPPGTVPVRAPAVDYSAAVRAHGDRFLARHADEPAAPAVDDGTTVRSAEAVSVDPGGLQPGDRVLVRRGAADWPSLRAALLAPLVARASTVMYVGVAEPAVLAAVAAQEQVTSRG